LSGIELGETDLDEMCMLLRPPVILSPLTFFQSLL
jgi:hypothetical protein